METVDAFYVHLPFFVAPGITWFIAVLSDTILSESY